MASASKFSARKTLFTSVAFALAALLAAALITPAQTKVARELPREDATEVLG